MPEENKDQSMVTVHETWGVNDADVVRSMLEAEDIEVYTSGFPQSVYPFTVDGLGRIEIRVLESDAARAVKLIESHSGE